MPFLTPTVFIKDTPKGFTQYWYPQVPMIESNKIYDHAKSPSPDKLERDCGRKGVELWRKLEAMQGLTDYTLSRYQLTLIRAYAFAWDQLDPQVEKAITEVFGPANFVYEWSIWRVLNSTLSAVRNARESAGTKVREVQLQVDKIAPELKAFGTSIVDRVRK